MHSVGVLEDVDLELRRGDFLAVLGANGAGKSTLLKMIAGIYRPDAGTVMTRGRIASLLELGTGFHPDFTGRENALINGSILGLSPAEVRERLPAVIEFSGLGAQIDAPVRTYSSGMYVRLAFSVAIHVQPTLLLVDEVMAVGDQAFQEKCQARIRELQAAGTTILFVSHNMRLVRRLAQRIAVIRDGHLIEPASPEDAIEIYAGIAHQDRSGASRPS